MSKDLRKQASSAVGDSVLPFKVTGTAKALQWELTLPRVSVSVAEGVRGTVAGNEPGETMIGLATTCSRNDLL